MASTQKLVMKNYFAIILYGCIFLFASCEKNLLNTANALDCGFDFANQAYELTIQEQYVTSPGQVSVFFKVDDNEGKPVAGLSSSNFSIFEKGRNDECFKSISVFESNARISPNTQIFRYNTMLVLDLSGSVLQGSFSELKNASKKFIENIMPNDDSDAFAMGIWWFDGEDQLHVLQNFTVNKDVLLSKIESLSQSISNDPSTDLYGAVLKSTDVITAKQNSFNDAGAIAASSVILFTDGTDQAARYSKQEALNAIQSASDFVSYYTIGLGDEIDQKVLEAIGESGSIIANNNDELEETFKQTAELVFDEANSFYLFEYCSPKRDGSGLNKLILEVAFRNERGFIQTEFDGTGFSSGCN